MCVSLRLFKDGVFVCVSHLGCSVTVCLCMCLTEAVRGRYVCVCVSVRLFNDGMFVFLSH